MIKSEQFEELKIFCEIEGDSEIRMSMARELYDMGIEIESIERILSIQITMYCSKKELTDGERFEK